MPPQARQSVSCRSGSKPTWDVAAPVVRDELGDERLASSRHSEDHFQDRPIVESRPQQSGSQRRPQISWTWPKSRPASRQSDRSGSASTRRRRSTSSASTRSSLHRNGKGLARGESANRYPAAPSLRDRHVELEPGRRRDLLREPRELGVAGSARSFSAVSAVPTEIQPGRDGDREPSISNDPQLPHRSPQEQ
jgi:hypothetical protein